MNLTVLTCFQRRPTAPNTQLNEIPVTTSQNLVDLVRQVGRSHDITLDTALSLRAHLHNLREQYRLPDETEVGAPALTARALDGVAFERRDLDYIMKLRKLAKKSSAKETTGQMKSDQSQRPNLRQNDFLALATSAYVDVAIREAASKSAVTPSNKHSTY
jgi:hypothetical protein